MLGRLTLGEDGLGPGRSRSQLVKAVSGRRRHPAVRAAGSSRLAVIRPLDFLTRSGTKPDDPPRSYGHVPWAPEGHRPLVQEGQVL